MDIIVRFEDNITEEEAILLIRDALADFSRIRSKPTILHYVLQRYPEQSAAWRSEKMLQTKRRVDAADAAQVLSFDDADIPRYTE